LTSVLNADLKSYSLDSPRKSNVGESLAIKGNRSTKNAPVPTISISLTYI